MSIETAHNAAEHFINNETPFHLGDMLTEQSHPVTRHLSDVLRQDTAAGIKLLLRVDDDLLPVIDCVIASQEFRKLKEDLRKTLDSGNKIFFSGCGATGRLSILLDAAHRKFCGKTARSLPELAPFFKNLAEQTVAVMTGGDFALIRSVESFEDYAAFGRCQVLEAGIRPEDCLVAISEGGETSSVIGTIHAAADLGCRTHFMFNNPAELLRCKVERSRAVIVDPRVNSIDLSTGQMAVAGSTRMQATTMELLIAGLAFEAALFEHLAGRIPTDAIKKIGWTTAGPEEGAARFRKLLKQIRTSENVRELAKWVDFERAVYEKSGLVTYFADKYMIDIFTDTTERAPTFMIPPFRSTLDPENPVSWAFVKDPMRTTEEAWYNILGHAPNCLGWTSDDYRSMDASQRIIDSPPKIDFERLKTYLIGTESDPSRTDASPNVALAFLVGDEVVHLEGGQDEWFRAFETTACHYEHRAAILVGPLRPDTSPLDEICFVNLDIPSTPLELFAHLAVKLVLNNVSTATMGKLGRLSGNWMAHVEATNKKLIDRSIRLISELSQRDYRESCYALFETLEELNTWSEARRKTISPAAYTVRKLLQSGVE